MVEKYKEIIMGVLKVTPTRRRELAHYCGCWVASPDLTKALHELKTESKIAERMHNDHANCDSYIEYYAT